ncbi:hypothetical protein [Rhodococcus sp. MEB032]|uniref:hypothetical protein n=1 Tax=Rhodococcus sp. MEB032 TaxID=3040322 RepID=UPI002549D5D7|nr:hypothetical protein [Rhodococcus sp. MEB032]
MGTLLTDLIAHPQQAITQLTTTNVGITVERAWAPNIGGYVLDLAFAPPPELDNAGYSQERARISLREYDEPLTFPLGPPRKWKHRYPSPLGADFGHVGGQLCLWLPTDPRPLRWFPEDGLEDYLDRVHRHLFLEEHWRRSDRWATEDAPHGAPTSHENASALPPHTHPISSRTLRRAVRSWPHIPTPPPTNIYEENR